MFNLIETHKAQRNAIEHLRAFLDDIHDVAEPEMIDTVKAAINELESDSMDTYRRLGKFAHAAKELQGCLQRNFEFPRSLERLMNTLDDDTSELAEYL